MRTSKIEEYYSSYEIKLELIEKYYEYHFDRIKNLKRLLIELQKDYIQIYDPKLRNKYIRTIKRINNSLSESENKTEQVIKNYETIKRNLNSLR